MSKEMSADKVLAVLDSVHAKLIEYTTDGSHPSSHEAEDYHDARTAVEKLIQRNAELESDAERLDWLDSHEAGVRFHRDYELACDGEYLIMVQIVKDGKSISGHPLGYVRDAIDTARKGPR